MQIPYPYTDLLKIIREVLCHLLGKGCNKDLILIRSLFPDLSDQVINLTLRRLNRDIRIQQSRRSYHLLCTQKFMVRLIVSRRCAYEQNLVYMVLKLFEIKWSVVHRRGKSEAVIHQCGLP